MTYSIQGPCQQNDHIFLSKKKGNKERHFVVDWFDEFDWLVYRIKENKTYCLFWYVCEDTIGKQ